MLKQYKVMAYRLTDDFTLRVIVLNLLIYVNAENLIFTKSFFFYSAPKITIASKDTAEELERSREELATKCCGLNYMNDGEDPVLKPYSEYPEWYFFNYLLLRQATKTFLVCRLLKIHTGPPKRYYDYDPNTREYWYTLEKEKEALKRKIKPKNEGKFILPPRSFQVEYISRLPKKKT